MTIPLLVVDAFAEKPFTGNPAAVCLLEQERSAAWMQSLAAEMKHSETAYLLPISEQRWSLRWFTPAVEVDLCGHATLASAHVLWSEDLAPAGSTITFDTRSGPLRASQNDPWIELDFPAVLAETTDPPILLEEALGCNATYVGRNRMDYLIEVSSEQALRDLKPDFRLLGTIDVRGVIVTARSADSRFDFVSRFFAPAAGVDEDPVTGSAHCCLAPYWQKNLDKSTMLGYQASERGGIVQVRVERDRVFLGGQAVTILRSELSSSVSNA